MNGGQLGGGRSETGFGARILHLLKNTMNKERKWKFRFDRFLREEENEIAFNDGSCNGGENGVYIRAQGLIPFMIWKLVGVCFIKYPIRMSCYGVLWLLPVLRIRTISKLLSCLENADFGLKVNHIIISILPACANIGALQSGREMHGFIILRMFYRVVSVHNSLVDMYAKCRSLETGIHVFDGMLKKDLVSWRIVIRGYIENERCIEASNVFSKMRLLSFFAPDEFVVQDMIMALLQSGGSKIGSAFHCYILKMASWILFPLQLHFCRYVIYEHETRLLQFNSLLQMCSLMSSQEASNELGDSIHAFIGKIRKGQAGTALFDEVPFKDLICWSSMINGYVLNGYGVEALDTFSNMLDCGIKPNEITFLSVLSACSHFGLEYEGWNWFIP
ncbi:pentatricopeptide repeat-containing protein DOT4, chloroplastic-like [Hibiscus syriacus]|uniref:pentatricopeptide repeat-containing protein DOT4, chloroplastic-like n=1 Tax=Hibiscus syriacus TaxID=106335 RepID=UPI0019242E48|nr:pentatricopeptide repeat-containing protein DOT4, chloroplastic-like [Hibiscus syriacus]